MQRMVQRGMRKLAAEACPTMLNAPPSAKVPELDEDFLDLAHSVLKEVFSPAFVVKTQDSKTLLTVTAPKFNNYSVLLKFMATEEGDAVFASLHNEPGGMLSYTSFPVHGYAKYSALFDDVCTWVCDKLFTFDPEVYNADKSAVKDKKASASPPANVEEVLKTSHMSQDQAMVLVVAMTTDKTKLPQGSAQFHLYTGRGLKKLAARAMQHLAIRSKEVAHKDFERMYHQVRLLIIKSMAHLMRSRDMQGSSVAKKMFGRAVMDIVSRFNKLENDLLDVLDLER